MCFALHALKSRGRFLLFACMLSMVPLMANSGRAQTTPLTQERPRRALPTEPDPQDIIKVDTDLVPLDVVATDAKGRLVRNLKKEDFKLYEDGIERPIASFNIEQIEGAPRP